ncbi:hypothetical protein BC829DRAFT_447537 [Chytridium lagenaria]|nr:hypothetical protein BC829DRAFT_447537 [Chytridium lagenaria]
MSFLTVAVLAVWSFAFRNAPSGRSGEVFAVELGTMRLLTVAVLAVWSFALRNAPFGRSG